MSSLLEKKYLSSNIINKIDNLFLKARLVVEGFIIGLHKSPYHGFSVEFSEHKPYGYGDEIKYIDWKLWAKTDKLFIKQFEEETNLKCHLILDKSSSMNFGSNQITKFEYSKTLVAALSYLMIKQQDAVGLSIFDTTIQSSITPKSKTSHLNLILKTLQNAKIGGETDIPIILHSLAESIKKRGLIILISDLIDNQDEIIKGLRHFRHKGHEVIVFHILDDNELNLNYNQSIQFEDLENNENIKTDPRHIKIGYKKSISEFCKKYKIECEKNKIDYINVNTSNLIDQSLLEYLIKRNKLS